MDERTIAMQTATPKLMKIIDIVGKGTTLTHLTIVSDGDCICKAPGSKEKPQT